MGMSGEILMFLFRMERVKRSEIGDITIGWVAYGVGWCSVGGGRVGPHSILSF
jgi:hypothetical protein